MTKADAVAWIRDNLPTATENGTEVTEYNHPTGEVCPACGFEHEHPIREYHAVDSLAEQYHEAMENSHPDAVGNGAPIPDVAKAAMDAAQQNGTGHDRFFQEASNS